MLRRFFLRLSAWALNQVYDQGGLIAHYCGALSESVETDMFGRGELLGLIQIWPNEKIGYDLDTYTKEECEEFTEIEGYDP